jgi:hypothetical protein
MQDDSVVCHLATAHHIHISASTIQRSPELSISGGVNIANKVEPMLALLVQLGLQNDEIELVLLRCAQQPPATHTPAPVQFTLLLASSIFKSAAVASQLETKMG